MQFEFPMRETELIVKMQPDITGKQVKMLYLKPDGTTGEWNAHKMEGANSIVYKISPNDPAIDQPGEWRYWGEVTLGPHTRTCSASQRLIVNQATIYRASAGNIPPKLPSIKARIGVKNA